MPRMATDQPNEGVVAALDAATIWQIETILPIAKLYLLALSRVDDIKEARRLAGVPADEVSALESWLVAKGYARPRTRARTQRRELRAMAA